MDKNQLKIGWATRDISTDKPIDIPGQGYIRISQGILDPVMVTALVIENRSDLVCFLSADLVTIYPGLLDEVRENVGKQCPDFPVMKILMNATHTHTGPDGCDCTSPELTTIRAELGLIPGNEFRKFIASQAADAVCAAYEKRATGGVAWGYGYAVVAHSRRTVYFDDLSKRATGGNNVSGGFVNGHASMYGKTNDEMFSGYEGGADHFVNLFYTFDENDKLTGAIINVPCPSQCTETYAKLSASFWHETREAIRERFGKDIYILPQCAAGGDLSPRILHYFEAQKRRLQLKYGREPAYWEEFERHDIAERITDAFGEALAWAKKDIRKNLPLAHKVETVQLSRRLVSAEEYAYEKEQLAVLEKEKPSNEGTLEERAIQITQLDYRTSRCDNIIRRYNEQDANPKIPMEMHVIRVGDIAFASNWFEIFIDYQHRIQARSPFEQTFIVQLSGQPGVLPAGGYLPTQRGLENKGYSACIYDNLVSPEGGQELVEETIKTLKEIYK